MRRAIRMAAVVGVLLLGAWPLAAAAQGEPSVEITSPSDGDTVTSEDGTVLIRVEVENFELVEPGTEPAEGEGHAHLIIDGEEPEAGDTLGDEAIHLGAEPFTSRDVELEPGEHTVMAVLADSAHEVTDPVASDEVTFTVEEAEEDEAEEEATPSPEADEDERPTEPADTGDGSLAGTGSGLGWILFAGLGATALIGRYVIRRR